MNDSMVRGATLPDTYHRALERLEMFGDDVYSDDWKCETKDLAITMVVETPLAEPMISKLFPGGPRELQQYVMEMTEGILDFEVSRGKWNYTYHQRMGSQIQFVIDELRRNPSSRRAVINIRTPDDMYSTDPACLQHIQYFIHRQKLDCVVLFRSNDAVKATFMNAFALIMLQKKIAGQLGVEVGTYTHRANSFHCYERDFQTLRNYVSRIQNTDSALLDNELTYNYAWEWEDYMEDWKDDILSQVEELRKR